MSDAAVFYQKAREALETTMDTLSQHTRGGKVPPDLSDAVQVGALNAIANALLSLAAPRVVAVIPGDDGIYPRLVYSDGTLRRVQPEDGV